MILFTTIDNIILESRVHFPLGLKIETYEHTPLATTLHSELKNGLGGYYMVNLKRPNQIIAYREFENEPNLEELYSNVTYITYLFSLAWLLKFNTFQIGDFWFYNTSKKTLQQLGFGHVVTEPASMKGKATLFSGAEIDEAIKLLQKFLEFNFPSKFEMNFGATDYPKLSVLQRAAELIELSKIAPNIFQKIGLLCSSLECLFTTDNTEVSHKVCERVAFFLSDNPNERLEIYRKIKTAYGHRSDFFHGNKLKNISDQVYFDIDQIVRQAAYKAIFEKSSIFLSGKETLSKYLLELPFGFE